MITPRDNGPPAPSEHQLMHLGRITEAAELLLAYMHDAEGSSQPGDHQEHTWSTRRMAIAATHIETAMMFAGKAALE
jgi:hypothetical protein